MKIFFINGALPNEQKDYYKKISKVPLQEAPDAFQWALIDGLCRNSVDACIVSLPFLPCFPHNFKKCHTTTGDLILRERKIGDAIQYNTIIGIKPFSIKNKIVTRFSYWAKSNLKKNEKIIIIIYAAPSYELDALRIIKQRFKNVEVCSIVTDLVDNMKDFSANRSFLKKIQCRYEINKTKSLYRFIDKFILLSKHMEERIPEAIGRNIIIEGIYSGPAAVIVGNCKKSNAILYTGTLEAFSGVKNLVDAFHSINNQQIELWICGSGYYSEYINSIAECDSRIKFYGTVSREQSIQLQKNAKVLINPRQPDGDITKYSFPSKTIEYLSSGTPMIGYRLEGIPEEYTSKMFIVDSLSIDALAEKIQEVVSLPQEVLNEKAQEASAFILEHKTCEKQVKKIINFLSN